MKTTLLSAAIGSVLAMGMIGAPVFAADDSKTEKCYGVAKAGKNDCAGPAHACTGQSKTNASTKEFITVPKGMCERLVGGLLAPK